MSPHVDCDTLGDLRGQAKVRGCVADLQWLRGSTCSGCSRRTALLRPLINLKTSRPVALDIRSITGRYPLYARLRGRRRCE